ncbi:hypothetical protein [Corynebacterium variabile]|uniref:hypothetical protein n=1 Tax=Corynebacterium variabile TaxID=1727 RepID=UPI002FE0769E
MVEVLTKRTDSPVCEDWPSLEGRQDPEVLISAGSGGEHGDKAIELARRFGVRLMPWQEEQVRLSLATDEYGRWVHQDVVLICPRQNGKSLILEVIILYRLFILHQQIIFTAQQWRTAKSIRNRLWKRIKSRKWAERRLVRNTASAGEAEMETSDGGKVQFTTRSNDAGRGFDQIDLLLLDEAYNLEAGELDSITPIQLAAPDPQTYYTSSAVNQSRHPKGVELSRVRDRALAGEAEGMLYSEFRAPDGADPADPETWKLANPSYGVVATEKKVQSLRSKLTDMGFAVEVLGWGEWFVTVGEQAQEFVFDPDRWQAATASVPIAGNTCLGIAVAPEAAGVALVLAVRTGAGVHVSLGPVSEFDRSAVVAAVKTTVDAVDPLAVVVDPKGPSSTVLDPLVKTGVEPECLNWPKVVAATELLLTLIAEGSVTHDADPRWVEAVEVAEFRPGMEKGRAFKEVRPVVSVLVAAAFAVWGLTEFEIPEEPGDVKMVRRFVGHVESVPAAPVAAAAQSLAF